MKRLETGRTSSATIKYFGDDNPTFNITTVTTVHEIIREKPSTMYKRLKRNVSLGRSQQVIFGNMAITLADFSTQQVSRGFKERKPLRVLAGAVALAPAVIFAEASVRGREKVDKAEPMLRAFYKVAASKKS